MNCVSIVFHASTLVRETIYVGSGTLAVPLFVLRAVGGEEEQLARVCPFVFSRQLHTLWFLLAAETSGIAKPSPGDPLFL